MNGLILTDGSLIFIWGFIILVCVSRNYISLDRVLLRLHHSYKMLPWYWKFHYALRQFQLEIASKKLNLQLTWRYAFYAISTSWLLLIPTTISIILTSTVTLGVIAIDSWLAQNSKGLTQFFLHHSFNHSPLGLVTVSPWAPQPSDYVTFLSMIAGASVALIALHIGVIGIIISTVYSKTSSALRELLLRERVSISFVRLLVFLFTVSSTLLFALWIGLKPQTLSTAFIMLLVMATVAVATRIATRAFVFFEPSNLLIQLNEELMEWLHLNALSSLGDTVPFQNQFRKRCRGLLDVYIDIVSICLERYKGHHNTLPKVAQHLMGLYVQYGQIKKSIATKSLWFDLTYKHPSWFTADAARISATAGNPGYPLLPEEKPDLYWVESKLCDMLTNLIEPDLTNNRLENLSRSLVSISNVMLKFGEGFLPDEAFYFHETLREKFFASIPGCNKLGEVNEKTRTLMAVIECTTHGIGNYIAGLNRFLSDFQIERFENTVLRYLQRTSPEPTENIYLPRRVLDTVFIFREKLEFERNCEGRSITPYWYVVSGCAVELANDIIATQKTLIDLGEAEFCISVDNLLSKKQLLCAAQAIQGGLLSTFKAMACLREAEATLLRLKELHKAQDLDWPKLQEQNLQARWKKVRQRLIKYFAIVSFSLLNLERDDTIYPDLGGQGYNLIADSCFEAIAESNIEDFEGFFSYMLAVGLSAQSWLDTQINNSDRQQKALLNYEIISDVLELSGYALAYSELNESASLKQSVEQLWDNILSTQPKPIEVIKYLLAMGELEPFSISFSNRSQSRFRWGLKFQADIRTHGFAIGLLNLDADETPLAERSNSAIITALVKRFGISPEVRYLLASVYLLKRPEISQEMINELKLPNTLGLMREIEKGEGMENEE